MSAIVDVSEYIQKARAAPSMSVEEVEEVRGCYFYIILSLD